MGAPWKGSCANVGSMSTWIVVGAQWGDEGKGKVIDLLTERADMVVRYAGGPNAGHTLVVGGKRVVVRLLPSGILRPSTVCVLGQGMVVEPKTLVGELDALKEQGIVPGKGNLLVSDRAHMILPYHVLVDELRERGERALGTTKRGVGPCYEDKAARRGIPLGVLRDKVLFEKMVAFALEAWRPFIVDQGADVPDVREVVDGLEPTRARVLPLLADTSSVVGEAVRRDKNVLLEGAQGTLLDIDHGTYPYVTSSHATAGGACAGAGVGPTAIQGVLGLLKAYTTRVGNGPFPTELHGSIGEQIRKAGAEFGSVTGRPRRTGWLDLPAVRYAARVNGLSGLCLTKLDVLAGLKEVRVCNAYRIPGRGEVSELPVGDMDRAEPLYTSFPGFSGDLSGARAEDDLPKEARDYVDFVERESGVKLYLVSVGSGRDETIVLRHPFA